VPFEALGGAGAVEITEAARIERGLGISAIG
jgi:hypothetical protein